MHARADSGHLISDGPATSVLHGSLIVVKWLMNNTLNQLAAVGSPRGPWSDYADILRDSLAVEDADRSGFTVIKPTGSEKVDVPGGLTESLYKELAYLVTDDEKGLLAKGVIDSLLRADWHTWHSFQEIGRAHV